jgi:Secretion system C-terminal sorting domain/PKD domain
MERKMLFRKMLSCLIVLFGFYNLSAQRLTRYEYWFDDNVTTNIVRTFSATSSGSIVADSANITALATGLHTFNARFGTATSWSATSTHIFYRFPNNSFEGISNYEYWFDKDIDKRITRPVSGLSQGGVLLDSVNTEGLSAGLHTFNIRLGGTTGWSSTSVHLFYRLPSNTNTIVSNFEYWFDDDIEGKTSRIVSSVQNGIVVDSVNTSSLSSGLHRFNIRVGGASGWSSLTTELFYKFDNNQSRINAIEYWLGNDFTNRKIKEIASNTEGVVLDSIDLNGFGDLCKGRYILHSRLRTQVGWSSISRDTFNKKVNGAVGATANYLLTVDASTVSLENQSTNATNYTWRFGNGDSSQLKSTFYTYPRPGVYNACLIARNNSICPNDTLCKEVSIVGIREIITNVSGRRSTVTVRIIGAGFREGTSVKLTRKGQTNQIPESIIVESNSVIRATFKFGLPTTGIGLWTVNVKLPTGDSLLLVEGFQLVDSSTTDLWINIVGDRIYRPGFQANYTIIYGNRGNTDAQGVFLFVKGFPKDSKIFILDDSIDIFKAPELDTFRYKLDSVLLSHEFYDSTSQTNYTALIIPRINALSLGTVRIKIIVPIDIEITRRYSIQANITAPLISSINQLKGRSGDLENCLSEIGKALLDFAREELYDNLNDVNKCIADVTTAPIDVFTASKEYSMSDKNFFDKYIYARDFAKAVASKYGSCAKAAGAILPQTKLVKYAAKVLDYFNKANELLDAGQTGYDIGKACAPLLPKAKDSMPSGTGRAFDPNIKYGPGMGSEAHYFSSPSRVMPYSILFENDTTATLSAQIITILDTLDKSKFDMSSFGFTYINIADSTISLTSAPKSFIQDIDLRRSTGNIARVTGSIDTVKGIIRWVFNTINPTTRQITTDPVAGILPPNRTKPQGEGSVGFIISKKQDLPDSTVIANKAHIIFDFNEPVITPTWKAISDDTPPISKVDALSSIQTDTSFSVSWSGRDNISGIKNYTIYVSKDNANYEVWKAATSIKSSIFKGERGSFYRFYSISIDSAGNIEKQKISSDASTKIDGTNATIETFIDGSWLGQNNPNPFSQTTEISYYLAKNTEGVEFSIYDLVGRVVHQIQRNKVGQGSHSILLDLNHLSSGIYLYQLKTKEGLILTRRMMLSQ